jgi:hypothetical protein
MNAARSIGETNRVCKKTTKVIEAFALTAESIPFARVDLVQAVRRLFPPKKQ